jgi:FAD/FMN-containing dehydrogenase
MSGQRDAVTAATGAPRVNDVHSQLNDTAVAAVVPAGSLEAICTAIARSREQGLPVAVSGGRHAMGGQQFCSGGLLLDTRPLARVLEFDPERGTIVVEAGIQWPALLAYLHAKQDRGRPAWGIRQKQTGADRLSVGGSLAANAHGRGLAFKPIVDDVESLTLVDGRGDVLTCSRHQNTELFRLVIGGYGLFGVVYSVTLRLAPRRRLQRVVEVRELDGLIEAFHHRIEDGFVYGDFQFSIDPADPRFLRRGVFSCYRPVEGTTAAPPADQRALTPDDWRSLLYLAHVDKAEAWERYTAHYLATSGQEYDSDAHQFAAYIDGYHAWLDRLTGASAPATEMITEIFVPRDRLDDFMTEAAEDFRASGVDLIYGTIRLIERDDETVLSWARDRWACVIFNLHTVHTAVGLRHSAAAFRRLIDMAVARGGSYFLTYHRWAWPAQVEACHPRFREFLAAKRRYDPDGRFQSDWYRHYAALLE